MPTDAAIQIDHFPVLTPLVHYFNSPLAVLFVFTSVNNSTVLLDQGEKLKKFLLGRLLGTARGWSHDTTCGLPLVINPPTSDGFPGYTLTSTTTSPPSLNTPL